MASSHKHRAGQVAGGRGKQYGVCLVLAVLVLAGCGAQLSDSGSGHEPTGRTEPSMDCPSARMPLLTLVPPRPKGGEVALVTGQGLQPGRYELVGDPMLPDAEEAIEVGSDGRIAFQFLMPHRQNAVGTCLRLGIARRTDGLAYEVVPFAYAGTDQTPGRCSTLPLPSSAGTIVHSSDGPQNTYVLSGTRFAKGFRGPVLLTAELLYARVPNSVSQRIEGSGAVDVDGRLTFTFQPPPNPDWAGKCVAVTAFAFANTPDGTGGGVLGGSTFDYP